MLKRFLVPKDDRVFVSEEAARGATDFDGRVVAKIVAEEDIGALSDVVAPAVLAVIDSGADAVLTALDNAQNGLVLD